MGTKGKICLVLCAIISLFWAGVSNAELVSRWEFNGNANDSVGSNSGTFVGNATTVNDAQRGQVLSLDGSGDYVQGATSPFSFENTTFTVAAWFKTSANTVGMIVGEDGVYRGWNLGTLDTGKIKAMLKEPVQSFDAYTATTVNSYNNGTWHHVAAVITTSTVTAAGNYAGIYIDGSLVAVTENNAYRYAGSNVNWRIGSCIYSNPFYFNGLIDDVRIYNNALTADEIHTLATPEPATICLLGLGVLGLIRRK